MDSTYDKTERQSSVTGMTACQFASLLTHATDEQLTGLLAQLDRLLVATEERE